VAEATAYTSIEVLSNDERALSLALDRRFDRRQKTDDRAVASVPELPTPQIVEVFKAPPGEESCFMGLTSTRPTEWAALFAHRLMRAQAM
jgi:hypothetical protein